MEDRRDDSIHLCAGQGSLGSELPCPVAPRNRETRTEQSRKSWGPVLSLVGWDAGVSDNSEEDDWEQFEGFDLRVGSFEYGDSALFHDAGDSGAAGLWADGDDGDLHDG